MGMSSPVLSLQGVVDFGDTTAKTLFTLPVGAVPLLAIVQVETAFNDSGTDLLKIGSGATTDYFASGINVGATGAKSVVLNEAPNLTRQTSVTATYTGQNGDSTTGRARINLLYSTPFDPV